MGKIDLDRLICSLMGYCELNDGYLHSKDIERALKEQNLEYCKGEILESKTNKFNVGDWFLCTNQKVQRVLEDRPMRIAGFDTKVGYQLEDQKGNGMKFPEWMLEDDFKPWTIQDAKDGDVLAEDTCIFIIKKLNHDLSAKIYCCLYDDGDFEINSNLVFDDTSTYPATNEQRNTLFQKMKELGYEWDEASKTLRAKESTKIERKLVGQNLPWDKKREDEVRKEFIISALEEFYKGYPPLKEELIEWLKSIEPQTHLRS